MTESASSPASPDSRSISRSNLWKAIGPGILVSCAAVGGSHLVWSTQAGARFGWSLLGLILLTNLLKFPFFLYGQRYTAATGESLLAGYHRLGPGYVWAFLIINVLTGTINIAGVAMLSGALLAGFGIDFMTVQWLTVVLIAVCAGMILMGRYSLLDTLSKVIIASLALCTMVAVGLALGTDVERIEDFVAPSPWTWASFAFLVSLMGWMPAPMDLSAWGSLWIFSREKQTGHFATVRETSIDFYLGYFVTVILAVFFVGLGALVMHGTGLEFSEGGIAFSRELVHLYAATIGEWSRHLILAAAFMTMFSTTLTCTDGYPRSLAACCALLWKLPPKRFQQIHQAWVVVATLSGALVVLFFVRNLLQLLTFAAVISFLTSPVLAYINYRVMNGENVEPVHRPGTFLKALSWAGLLFFLLMTAGYVYVLFFWS